MRVKITVMYDGTQYCGWQIQKGQKSVQGEITSALFRLTGETVSIVASGRTDAGVHALGQVAHFDLPNAFDIKKIPAGLNFYLDQSIRVIDAALVTPDFNARFSAKRKTYIYKMYKAEYDNPLLLNRAVRVGDIDTELMKKAAALFVGEHDFVRYKSSGSDTKTSVRTVYQSAITVRDGMITFKITANGFLYNMVRKIVGVLLSVGSGKCSIETIKDTLAPPFLEVKENAPPQGLYLHSVKY